MCGILLICSKKSNSIILTKEAEKAFNVGKNILNWDIDKKFTGPLKDSLKTLCVRGPDCCDVVNGYYKDIFYILGFTRLAINDLSSNGMQPFSVHTVLLICNGEIYNHKDLEKQFEIQPKSSSDCEVIAHLYLSFGIEETIRLIEGDYAFVLLDTGTGMVYFKRDRIGVRPLFYSENEGLMIASEAKPFEQTEFSPKQLSPLHYGTYDLNNSSLTISSFETIPQAVPSDLTEKQIMVGIQTYLIQSVKKRLMSDREIGCMLSGGVDSSIIAGILSRLIYPRKLNTFSVGFEDSIDLRYAREVSKFLGSNHHEVILTKEQAMNSVPDVIYALESYDTTTVRASVGMYLLSKYISENFKEKVILSGEGSDEIFGGYLYFHFAPSDKEFEDETVRLITELPYYDVLRADRCTASNGLELRVPFLDKDFLDYCLKLPGNIRKPRDGYEKWILRKSFETFVPDSVLWRRKMGFSDAIGGPIAWYKCIQEYAETIISNDELAKSEFKTKEDIYYYNVFSEKFKKLKNPTLGKWKPRWVNMEDPSNMALEKRVEEKWTKIKTT